MGHWNALSYSDQHGVVLVNSVLRYRIRCIAHKCNSYLMPHAALSLLHPLTADNVAIKCCKSSIVCRHLAHLVSKSQQDQICVFSSITCTSRLSTSACSVWLGARASPFKQQQASPGKQQALQELQYMCMAPLAWYGSHTSANWF